MQGERPDVPERVSTDADAEVVGAYDDVDDERAFLVADIARDGAWLSVAAADALDLETWR